MSARLEKAGITDVPALWKLGAKEARGLWGSIEGERFWNALHGLPYERPVSEKRMFGHSRMLSFDWRTPERVHDCARQLSLSAVRRLRRTKLKATQLTLSVRGGGSRTDTARRSDHQRWSTEMQFEAMRDDASTLEQLAAAIAHYRREVQHEVQLRVFEQMRYAYNPSADAIRRMVASGSMRGNDPIALLIGEDAYVAAGGKIERDLFSEAADDRWIDIEIAHRLAAEKMEAEAQRITAETGLAWISPVASTNSWQARSEMGVNAVRLPPAPLSVEARARIDAIDARMEEISAIIDEGDDSGDEGSEADFGQLEAEYEDLDAERSDLNNPVRELPEEWRSEAGRFLVLTTRGEMVLEADYYSEKRLSFETDENGKVTATAEEPVPDSTKRGSAAPSRPEAVAPGTEKPISARLFDELSVQRRNILSASLLTDPGLALDFAVFALADSRSYESRGTSIKGGRPSDPATGELSQSTAEGILAEAENALDTAWQEHGCARAHSVRSQQGSGSITPITASAITHHRNSSRASMCWKPKVSMSGSARKGSASRVSPGATRSGNRLAR
ncbi:hypothetical protein [Novosphingobium sp. B1]|uniref:DinB/UmuC family translesion DNA polymerase n=1 Tax=Novosphingobium sp. B1 TaxID=1938756 RepID=UPI000A064B0F|nr:hypothetical protein [Novosphingobium sp. B1]